jgi:glycerol uptake facilitator-like aquaporin
MIGKRNAAAVVAEFLGTSVLVLLILTIQRSQLSIPFFISIAAGLALAMAMFVFGRVSGAHFNPAITIGLWTVRKVSTVRAAIYVLAQLLGGVAAYFLFTYFIDNSFKSIAGDFSWRIFVAEAVGAGLFALGWAAALYQGFSRAVTASMAGLSYTVSVLAVSTASLGLLNPAAALGVRSWVWTTYVLGPIVGGVIGINLYARLFAEPEVVTAGPVAVKAKTAAAKTVRTTKAKTTAAKRKTAKK